MTRPVRVPFYDHGAAYREIKLAIDAALHRVLASGAYEQATEVAAFEAEFAAYLDVPHAVATGSCGDAIERALSGCGIGPGDEVITVSNTDIACTAAIHRVGATTRFVDIREETYNMDPEDLAAHITTKTRGILVVHMYGLPADMTRILEIASRHDLAVIEDCALAVGARFNGRCVGTFADAGCFSHAPSKILSNYGDGGTLVLADAERAERARHAHLYWQMRDPREHRFSQGFHLVEEGSQSRMVEWTAAVLRVKLQRLEEWIARRRRIAETYTERLQGVGLILPAESRETQHVYRNYVVRVPRDRDGVRKRLAESGIETGMHYAPPLHLQPVYESLGYRAGDLPATERVADDLLGLPIYPTLSEEQLAWIVTSLRKAIEN